MRKHACCCSVTKSGLTLCDPVDCGTLCPSLSPRVCSDSCPLSRWCYLTISSSAAPFFCLQSFPSSGSFPVSWLFRSSGQSIGGASALASVLPVNIQGWFPLGLTVHGTFKSLFQHHNSKVSILWRSAFFMVQFSYLYMTTGETVDLTIWTFVSKVMSLLFNMLSRFVIAFLPRSKYHLISWLQSLSAAILEPKKMKSVTAEKAYWD